LILTAMLYCDNVRVRLPSASVSRTAAADLHEAMSRPPQPERGSEHQDVLAIDREGLPALLLRPPDEVLFLLALADLQRVVTIGRHSQSVITIDWDPEVSRTHAMVERLGHSWFVSDDGLSQNGTYVNGARISGRHRLVDGDVVRLGATLIAFRHKQSATDASTARAADAITPEQVTPMQMKVLRELCRPYKNGSSFDAPATNRQIADELQLSPEAVKTHMRGLFERFEVGALPQNQKRARVVELAMSAGLVRPGEL